MKPLLHPVPITCAVITVLGAVLGNVPMMLLALIAGVASVGFLSARTAQLLRGEHDSALSADGRALLSPVRKLAAEIEEVIHINKASQVVRILGTEGLVESQRLVTLVVKSLVSRDEMIRSLRGRTEAEKAVRDAQLKLTSAGPDEKESLIALIAARTLELGHYAEIERRVKQIELSVREAEAALAEMKARLSLSASTDQAVQGEGDDLRETLSRMKNLNDSYEESAGVIEGA